MEVRRPIRVISIANTLWGAPRIHGELLEIGIDVSQSTVAKYMVRGKPPPTQGWLTFLRNHADGIAAIDLFVVPTLGFRVLFGLVILNHDRRKIAHVAATYHPTSEWIARQVVEAFPWETAPRYLLRNRDGAYGKVFRKHLSGMGIRDRSTSPRSPWQNGYVERVIGSIRRDLLDHVIVAGEGHLCRLLCDYADCYNDYRTHIGLNKATPLGRPVHDRGRITAVPKLGGLHHAIIGRHSLPNGEYLSTPSLVKRLFCRRCCACSSGARDRRSHGMDPAGYPAGSFHGLFTCSRSAWPAVPDRDR